MRFPYLTDAERVGPNFSIDGILSTRRITRQAIVEIAAQITPGMTEEEATVMAYASLINAGIAKTWHPTRVRFGTNTTKAMKEESDPGVILQPDDIFFIDIAPRIDLWEGDGGATFTVGNNPDFIRCAGDARELFHDLRHIWLRDRCSGRDLYAKADDLARKMGWRLNPALPGHRLSDFPHASIHTGALAEWDAPPSSLRWILEIHLRHPSKPFGAFFEDLLMEDGEA